MMSWPCLLLAGETCRLRIPPQTPFRASPRADPVEEDGVRAEVERGVVDFAQPQPGDIGDGKRVAPDPQPPDRFIAGIGEARPQQPPRDGWRIAVGDEKDFVHVPGE